ALGPLRGAPLRAELDRLVAAELLDALPNGAYRFRHALGRDAIYASQGDAARREIHTRIAHTLERDFPQVVADQPEVMARHLAEAGRTAEAAVQWCRAASRERRRGCYAEASAHLRRAEALLPAIAPGAGRDHLELEIFVTL